LGPSRWGVWAKWPCWAPFYVGLRTDMVGNYVAHSVEWECVLESGLGTKCMEQGHYWEANSPSVLQEIPPLLFNPKVYYRAGRTPHCILAWALRVPAIFFTPIPSVLLSFQVILPFSFLFVSELELVCYIMFLDLITLTKSGGEHKRCSSLWNLAHLVHTHSFLNRSIPPPRHRVHNNPLSYSRRCKMEEVTGD
jgi:hypothetical protein